MAEHTAEYITQARSDRNAASLSSLHRSSMAVQIVLGWR
jgi:hypothetical protein